MTSSFDQLSALTIPINHFLVSIGRFPKSRQEQSPRSYTSPCPKGTLALVTIADFPDDHPRPPHYKSIHPKDIPGLSPIAELPNDHHRPLHYKSRYSKDTCALS